MPQGPTIVYLNKNDDGGRASEPVSLFDMLCRMVEDEPALHNALAFHRAYIDCMEFAVTQPSSDTHKLTDDVMLLRNFCKDSLVYYYLLGFVAFRLVPNAQNKRVLEPHCIPIRQISFAMRTDDFVSTHKTPAVCYRDAGSLFGSVNASGEQRPQILVYKFPPTLLDAFSLGPLSTLISAYIEVLKVREHNSIVLSEHANSVNYIESSSEKQAAQTSNTVLSTSIQSKEELEYRKGLDALSSDHDFEYTREVLDRQVEMTEMSRMHFLEQRRQQFIILPKDTRVSASGNARASFASGSDTSRNLHSAIAKLFGIPERVTSGAGRSESASMPAEPMGVRLQRKVFAHFFTILASVLCDPSLLDKLVDMAPRKPRAPHARAKSAAQSDESIALLALYSGPKATCEVSMNDEDLAYTASAHGFAAPQERKQEREQELPHRHKRKRSKSPRSDKRGKEAEAL